MKNEMKTSLQRRFADAEENEKLLVATILDPRFKEKLQKLDAYLAEQRITFGRESCYSWWANNRHRFPYLVKVARQYLCAPPTSVGSERLFSGAGDVLDDKRNRVAPEKAEMLLFIKNNFSLQYCK